MRKDLVKIQSVLSICMIALLTFSFSAYGQEDSAAKSDNKSLNEQENSERPSKKQNDLVDENNKSNDTAKTEDSEDETETKSTSFVQDSGALVETEEVVSTRLKKMDMGGPSPEITITGKDIANAGYNSVADILRDQPVAAFGGDRETSGLAARAGLSTIDLRGLGSDNTLVLLNGVRMAPIGGSDTVDLNRIPVAMVKELKIIKDDLSSIYGSDAIGGVVNIITYDSYTGLSVSGGATASEYKGGERYNLSVVGGSSSANTNIVFSLGVRKNKKIFASDREWSKNGTSTLGSPGSYRDVGTGPGGDGEDPWSVDPTCPPGQVLDAGPQGQFCTFNYTEYSTTLPQLEQIGLFTSIEHKITDFVTWKSDFFYNRNKTNYIYAPAPGIFNVPAATADTYGLPNHTNGNDMQVRYRLVELGNRNTFQENNFLGINSGLKWEFFDTWSAQLKGSMGQERNDGLTEGNAITADLNDLITNGDFNPLGPAGSRGDITPAAYQSWSKQVSSFYLADLRLEGEAFEILGSPFVLTTGATYMYRTYDNQVDELSRQGKTFTGAGSNGGADRHVFSTYAQLTGRITQDLDLFLSGRYDKYNDFGETINPKLGFKYKVTDDLLWRGTVGTGFKAPQLNVLYGARSESYISFIDRVACKADRDAGVSDPQTCKPQQYRTIYGGNKDLDEITSFSYNTGLVYNPTTDLDVSLDFWTVIMDGIIWGASSGALEDVTRAELAGVNPEDYGVFMNRDSNGYLDTNNPILAPSRNLSTREAGGLDITINYRIPVALGSFHIGENLSYRLKDISSTFPGLPDRDYVETHWVPRWRNNFKLAYQIAKHNLGFTFISTDKSKNSALTGYVDGYTRVDFAYNYSGFKDASLTLGVQNLLRDDPPTDSTNPNTPLNTSLYSQVGPLVYSNFTYHF